MMRAAIPCDLCGEVVGAHWQLWEHLHQALSPDQVKSIEWAATKAVNRLEAKFAKWGRRPWQPKIQRIKSMMAPGRR